MNLVVHILISAVLFVILFPFYGFLSLLVFVSGVLIDIDHLIHYYSKFKNFNLKRAYYFYKSDTGGSSVGDLFLFHHLDLFVVFVAFSFFSKSFFILTLGLLFHYILDYIHELYIIGNKIKARSFFGWMLRKKYKKQKL